MWPTRFLIFKVVIKRLFPPFGGNSFGVPPDHIVGIANQLGPEHSQPRWMPQQPKAGRGFSCRQFGADCLNCSLELPRSAQPSLRSHTCGRDQKAMASRWSPYKIEAIKRAYPEFKVFVAKPSLDSIVVEFLERYEVYVKLASSAEHVQQAIDLAIAWSEG